MEDVDHNLVTQSVQADIAQNGGGVVHQLFTRALIKSNMMLSQVVLLRSQHQSVICPRTEDADQNMETLSAQLVTVHNGGGVVHPLFTSQLIKPNMMPNQLVLLRKTVPVLS